MKFQLTKHQKMWEYLAENLPVCKPNEDAQVILEEYQKKWLVAHGDGLIHNLNYTCDYAYHKDSKYVCANCPLLYKCDRIYEELFTAMRKQDDNDIWDVCMIMAKSPLAFGVSEGDCV